MAILEPPPSAQRQQGGEWQENRLLLNAPPGLLAGDRFFELCQANPALRMELTATGRLIIMPPEGAESGHRNADVTIDLGLWNRHVKTGIVFGSSTGFTLPDGTQCSPDASWIEKSRWEVLDPVDRKKFAHICPDFVVELRSETDRLPVLQDKMREYIANGARLGWLIDPQSQRVEVYRPGQDVRVLENPQTVSGDPELPGFVLNLEPIWQT
ncbi:MAG: Uma2 family endonuclease [Armatimonadetes bacterium]|nr:Uma2 family endonuclease [Armatimonadota bacterium]